jgi:hypothetical protein
MVTFSRRFGFGGGAKPQIYEDAPKGLRIGIWNLIEDYVEDKCLPPSLPSFETLYNNLTAHFRLRRIDGPGYAGLIKRLVLDSFEWNEIFDVIEFLFTEVFYLDWDDSERSLLPVPAKVGDARYQYTIAINKVLSSENIGWKLKKGRLERIGSEILEGETIEKARKLLMNTDFEGPNVQFNKALGFFNKRPRPDLENCVKESVCALEGLVRIILKDKNITLGDATSLMVGRKIIRKPFDKIFHALYGFVSSEPGLRHGAHALSTIDIAETEFVLYNSAVCMVFIANRFGVMPREILPTSSRLKALKEELPKPDKPPEFPEDETPDTPVDDDEVPF